MFLTGKEQKHQMEDVCGLVFGLPIRTSELPFVVSISISIEMQCVEQ